MAYVVSRPAGRWELRESVWTHRGPRSRTLATFRTLTADAISHARSRATKPLTEAAVRIAAHRAGAPVSPPSAERAAAELLRDLARGSGPRTAIQEILIAALRAHPDQPARLSDAAAASAGWLAASPTERGQALRDLMLLADRIPHREAPERPRFPTIHSSTT